MPRVSHEKVAELKEALFILDSSGNGTVSLTEIRGLLDSLLYGKEEDTFTNILKELDLDGEEYISFAQFFVFLVDFSGIGVLAKEKAEENLSTMDLCAAFAPFDPDDSGMVDASVFFYLMAEKGNGFSPKEQEALRTRLEQSGHLRKGRVHYKAFVGNLVATSVESPFC
ncbi:hypothetical protein JKF63_05044 [Porcisia hertigi]|uniref:EF-hand domain-containing protein n=1 Tax=Porcisia hertigi TaxID=2761500 RepID=A0A836I5V4_9TRYP|nr:hypothetical protein JKF63_05044 [Porcisia hertigi]